MCAVHWGDIVSVLEDIMICGGAGIISVLEGIQYIRDIISALGISSVHWGICYCCGTPQVY